MDQASVASLRQATSNTKMRGVLSYVLAVCLFALVAASPTASGEKKCFGCSCHGPPEECFCADPAHLTEDLCHFLCEPDHYCMGPWDAKYPFGARPKKQRLAFKSGQMGRCPALSVSPRGSTRVTNCHCPGGHFGENGTACTPCPANSYSPTVGAASSSTCLDCPAGRHTSRNGSSSVSDCILPPVQKCRDTYKDPSPSTITYESVWNDWNNPQIDTANGFSTASADGCASCPGPDGWVAMDLGADDSVVYGVDLQASGTEWVTSFAVSVGPDNAPESPEWEPVDQGFVFEGATASYVSGVFVRREFSQALTGRYMRIEPKTRHNWFVYKFRALLRTCCEHPQVMPPL